MRNPIREVLCLSTLALTLAALQVPGTAQKAQPGADEAQKKATAECLRRMAESTSLRWNATQIQAWSRYEGDDVLPRLLDVYAKPPGGFPDNTRYLSAAAWRARHDIGQGTRIEPTAADIKALRAFVNAHARSAENIWGLYCAACILALQDDAEIGIELLGIVGDKRAPAVVKAAMIAALAHGGFEYMRRALEVMLAEDFKESAESAVTYEAICWAAARAYQPLHMSGQAVSTEWRPVFDRIVALMEARKTLLPRSLREASLALQFCFGTKHPYQFASMWRLLFDNGLDPLGDDDGATVASFMGLDVMGERIVFLIDASDSMLNPLGEKERDGIKGPVTGDKKKKKGEGHEIDWDKVKNRFDVAREHVKWTISRLPKDKQVCVILFGDKAEPLVITDGFVSAGNATRIANSLDAIRPKDAPEAQKETRPYGVLMGETNYYHALLGAFRMAKGGGITAPREHYDLKLLTEGADAIFLLSDGAPIRDGFSGDSPVIDYEYEGDAYYDTRQPGEGEWVEFPGRPAQPEREVETRDPETGAIKKVKVPAQPAVPPSKLWRKKEKYSFKYEDHDDNGPYASTNSFGFAYGFELNNLLDEVERMNLVRRCRIHCIGIGEAQMGWLKPIAAKGGGRSVYFGKDGEREAADSDFPGFPGDD